MLSTPISLLPGRTHPKECSRCVLPIPQSSTPAHGGSLGEPCKHHEPWKLGARYTQVAMSISATDESNPVSDLVPHASNKAHYLLFLLKLLAKATWLVNKPTL